MASICLEPYITKSPCLGSRRQVLTFMAAQISGRKASRMVLCMHQYYMMKALLHQHCMLTPRACAAMGVLVHSQ